MIAIGMMPQIAAAEVTLKVADTFPPGHYIVETGTTYWMDRVTELTDGEIKFQYFGAGQLGSLRDMFSMVQTGVVDIGYVPPAYNGGTMPLAGVPHCASQHMAFVTMNTPIQPAKARRGVLAEFANDVGRVEDAELRRWMEEDPAVSRRRAACRERLTLLDKAREEIGAVLGELAARE